MTTIDMTPPQDLDTTRCPYDLSDLLIADASDEDGIRDVFVCKDGTHTFPAINNSGHPYPDFSEVEL